MSRCYLTRLSLLYLIIALSINHTSAADDSLFKTVVTAWASTTSDVLMNALSVAYSLQDNNVGIETITEASGYPSGKLALMNKNCDFVLTATSLTAVDQTVYPNLIQIPIAAVPVVPVFNLGDPSITLILTSQTLALIFSRNITMWNDPLIVRDNNSTGTLSVNLPSQSIVMILPIVTRVISTSFNNALQKLYPSVNQTINQFNNQSIYSANPAASVAANLYSISFCQYQAAVRVGVAIPTVQSKAGTKIAISQTYIDQAVATAAAARIQSISNPTTRSIVQLDFSAAPGSTSWPYFTTEYLLVDLVASRSTCAVRADVVEFLVWMLSSDTATAILNLQQLAALPEIALSQLDLLNRLQNTVLCRGSTAVARTVVNGIVVSGDPRTNTVNSLILIEYNSQLSAVDASIYQYVWTPTSGELAIQQVLANEASLAMAFKESVPDQLWQEGVVGNTNNWAVPLMLFATEFGFNVQLNSVVRLPVGSRLVMSFQVMWLVMTNIVTDWSDPRITQLNPALGDAFAADNTSTPAPITLILGCDSFDSASIGAFTTGVMSYWLDDVAPLPDIPNKCANSPLGNNPNVKYVQTESMIGAAGSVTPGSFIYRAYAEDVLTNVSPIDILHQGTIRSAGPDAMLACVADVIDHTLLLIPAMTSTNPSCYLFTQTLYGITPNTFSSASSGPGSCISGSLSHEYIVYLYNLTNTDMALRAAGTVRVSESETVRAIIDSALEDQGLTCDGVSLLKARDVTYVVDDGLHSFGLTAGVLGLVATFIGASSLIVFKRHPSVSKAKLSFSFVSSCGIACLFASLLAVVSPTSNESCGTLIWLINIGYTLAYGPMLLKTGRLYAMYNGGRLVSKTSRWSTERLLQALGALIVLDLAVLIAWQGAAPFTVVETERIEGDNNAKHIYRMCGQPSDGMPFLLIMTLVKGICLVLGAMMSFTIRRLSTAFNESKHIAILFYNTVVVSSLFIPIGITQIGDAQIALFAIGILWISVATWVVLFAPKFIAINTPKHELKQKEDQSEVTDELNPDSMIGFTFANIGAMKEDTLADYIASLTSQIKKLNATLKDIDPALINIEPPVVREEKAPLKKGHAPHASMSTPLKGLQSRSSISLQQKVITAHSSMEAANKG